MLQPTTVTSLEALAMMVGCVLGAGFMACFLIALTGDGIVHRVAGDAARNPAVVVRLGVHLALGVFRISSALTSTSKCEVIALDRKAGRAREQVYRLG